MFGFGNKAADHKKDDLNSILARHAASLAAERREPVRTDAAPPPARKKAAFGKRVAS